MDSTKCFRVRVLYRLEENSISRHRGKRNGRVMAIAIARGHGIPKHLFIRKNYTFRNNYRNRGKTRYGEMNNVRRKIISWYSIILKYTRHYMISSPLKLTDIFFF